MHFNAKCIAACLLALCFQCKATTILTEAIEISESSLEELRHLACSTGIDEISARRWLNPPTRSEHAEIQCKPYGKDHGILLGKFVRCLRPTEFQAWTCQQPMLTATLHLSDRPFVIRYQFTTLQQAVAAVSFLLTTPAVGDIKVQSAWIAPKIDVYQSGANIHVMSDGYVFYLLLNDVTSSTEFRLTSVARCELDVCRPLTSQPVAPSP